MYAKIINNETKQCEVGLGTNSAFYKSIGMTEIEVEQAYDGQWYLKGYAPEAKEGFKIKWTGEAWEYEEEKKEQNEWTQYEPTDEEKKQMKRWERNDALEKVMARVQRYQTQKEAGMATTDDNKTYSALLHYAQYLRDFPQQDGEWWTAPILTFEEWGAAQ